MEKREQPGTPQKENARRERGTCRDWLTGLYSREALRRKADKALAAGAGGLLLLLDLDGFRAINERRGHLAGDRLLRAVGEALPGMFFAQDVIARVGGDEFAVFVAGSRPPEFAAERVEQLCRRLKGAGGAAGLREPLSVAVGAGFSQPGDLFEDLFARAEKALLAEKQAHAEAVPPPKTRPGRAAPRDICTDMASIQRELTEPDAAPGPYCQDYENFKRIYRFVERGLRRSGSSAYLVLLTLTDGRGDFIPLGRRGVYLELLGEAVRASLRGGDVYTRYSSCQLLVMLCGLSRQEAERVGGRVSAAFTARCPQKTAAALRFDLYPLRG